MIQGLNPYPDMKDSGVEWLGKVPKHWKVWRTRSLLSRNDSGVWGSDYDDDDGVIVVRSTEQKMDGGWDLSAPAKRKLTDNEFRSSRLEEGDLVVTKSSGSPLHIGKTSLVSREIASLDCCFSNFMQRLRVRQNAVPRFLWYVFNCDLGRRQFEYLSDTTTGLANLNREIIGSIYIANPTFSEQIEIVRFLDHADQITQRYIQAKQKLIQHLEEQKQTVIHQAVTGQIDVRTGKPYSAYKPSGLEWLGDVPEHWDLARLKTLLRERNMKGFPNENLLAATQTKGVVRKEDYKNRTVLPTKDLHNLKLVKAWDFVISLRSFEGGIEYAREQGIISPAYTVLYPIVTEDHGYIATIFKSAKFTENLGLFVTGIRQGQNIDYDRLSRSVLPRPPRQEQSDIVRFTKMITEKTTVASNQTRKEIDLLREFKASFIADVVSGKLNVQDVARK